MSAERLSRELADMAGRGPVRRAILTEMAEVRSRRNTRARLIEADTRAMVEYESKVPERVRPMTPDRRWSQARENITRRQPMLDADREHLNSLRRVLAAYKEARHG